MDFKIEHHSSYVYSAPVFLEPHYLYFYPSARSHIELLGFEIEINPTPQGYSSRMDAENNIFHQCWFLEKTHKLDVTAVSKVRTNPINPFNFLVDQNRESTQQKALQLFLTPLHPLSSEIKQWLDRFGPIDKANMSGFLLELCQTISAQWDHTIRYGEHLIDPNICFSEKIGSCRDLAWMLIQLLRSLELPSRFASGYCYNPELTGHELHAWVETWMAGAGWVGLDPTAGLLVTGEYIPVSTSYHPANTLPVQGTYRGDATSELATTVDIQIIN